LEESGALANKKQQRRDRLISLRSTALIRYAPRVTKQIQKRWTTQGASRLCEIIDPAVVMPTAIAAIAASITETINR
jgi:hypothetical protein